MKTTRPDDHGLVHIAWETYRNQLSECGQRMRQYSTIADEKIPTCLWCVADRSWR